MRVSERYKVGVSERDRKRERYFVKVCVLERETEMVLMCWHQTWLQYKANKDVLKCTKMDKKIFLILFVVATFLPFLVFRILRFFPPVKDSFVVLLLSSTFKSYKCNEP